MTYEYYNMAPNELSLLKTDELRAENQIFDIEMIRSKEKFSH